MSETEDPRPPELPSNSNELIDQLLKGYQTPEQILGQNGLLKQLTQAVIERALGAELTTHLGYEKHASKGRNSGNSRNGHSKKTVKSQSGELALEVPRDRNGTLRLRSGQAIRAGAGAQAQTADREFR
jgi:transposase-like protein